MAWYELLAAALTGGATASVLTGFFALQGKHTEQLREQMLTAADGLVTGAQQAYDALYVIYRDSDDVTAGKHLDEYSRLVREASARIGRILLLYGPGTPASDAADEAISALDYARKTSANQLSNALLEDSDHREMERARKAVFADMDEIDAHIREFSLEAWKAMKKPTRRDS